LDAGRGVADKAENRLTDGSAGFSCSPGERNAGRVLTESFSGADYGEKCGISLLLFAVAVARRTLRKMKDGEKGAGRTRRQRPNAGSFRATRIRAKTQKVHTFQRNYFYIDFVRYAF
jgi:hypothetical protein